MNPIEVSPAACIVDVDAYKVALGDLVAYQHVSQRLDSERANPECLAAIARAIQARPSHHGSGVKNTSSCWRCTRFAHAPP